MTCGGSEICTLADQQVNAPPRIRVVTRESSTLQRNHRIRAIPGHRAACNREREADGVRIHAREANRTRAA